MPSELEGQVALVTGGGRGVGANIARELAAAGVRVAVSARSADQVEEVAREIEGLAVVADVSTRSEVDAMVAKVESELGPIDLLVANAGVALWEPSAWKVEGMIERGSGRIVITASGAAYLPGSKSTAYSSSKASVTRFGETLALQLEPYGIPVFPISPGLVRTEMTEGAFPDDAPWTSPEAAPRLVRELAGGRFDRLSGRYIHAEHDPPDELEQRIDAILGDDLNAIRLRR
jgi:3-oxoacyl-[acyl-carrier protein] reductase